MKVVPLNDKILVKRLEAEEKTTGGILLPDSAKEKPRQGTVLSLGEGKRLDNGKRAEFQVKVNDRVLFSSYAGTEVAIQGYASLSQIGVAKFSAFISAYFNTREVAPLVSSIALAATVGCGYTARLGAMRISEEIDALEVMGVDSMVFLCATRLLAAWIVLPFMYLTAIGVAFGASYLAIVEQIGYVSSGGYLLIFWQFQNAPDLLFSVIKGMSMATVIVLVACYYGYTASGGPVGVGTATAKSIKRAVAATATRSRAVFSKASAHRARRPASVDRGVSARAARCPAPKFANPGQTHRSAPTLLHLIFKDSKSVPHSQCACEEIRIDQSTM